MNTRRTRVAALATLATFASIGATSTSRASVTNALPAAAPESLLLVMSDTGNHARYRVREQLVGVDFPNDAVGKTDALTGMILVGTDGKVSPQSRFVIDVRTLKSDKDRRDSYVQSRLLETAKYPSVTLAITGLNGLHLPLGPSGAVNFTLRGDLTVKGVTKPTTWNVQANIHGKDVDGAASTAFTFADFGMTKPHVSIVLSVEDTIKLEYDFRMIRK